MCEQQFIYPIHIKFSMVNHVIIVHNQLELGVEVGATQWKVGWSGPYGFNLSAIRPGRSSYWVDFKSRIDLIGLGKFQLKPTQLVVEIESN